MRKPILLDLFCGAGGATKGYQDAGFEVWGVDLNPQPNYCGDRFIRGDAVEYLAALVDYPMFQAGYRVAAIHASPPCQYYSLMSQCRPGLAEKYPDLVQPVQRLLDQIDVPWVIENVPGSPLRNPIELCGYMFDHELIRHRLFEANFPLIQPDHKPHLLPGSKAGHWTPGTTMSVSGHIAPVAHARKIMAIDWTNREELAEAIPPYYSEYVGRQLMTQLNEVAA